MKFLSEILDIFMMVLDIDQLVICVKLFHDGGPYHIEISPLICRANQWTGFYMIGTSVMKELNCILTFASNQGGAVLIVCKSKLIFMANLMHATI